MPKHRDQLHRLRSDQNPTKQTVMNALEIYEETNNAVEQLYSWIQIT